MLPLNKFFQGARTAEQAASQPAQRSALLAARGLTPVLAQAGPLSSGDHRPDGQAIESGRALQSGGIASAAHGLVIRFYINLRLRPLLQLRH